MKNIRQNDQQPERPCDHAGCDKKGEYKAPKDKSLKEYYWFCLQHVEEYNKNWDYLAGSTPEEIENKIREDVVWHRPTWKLGQRKAQVRGFGDLLDLFEQNAETELPRIPKECLEAFGLLNLSLDCSVAQLKSSYKKLAKKYHPDLNAGDKKAEEKFKTVTQAYHLLLSWMTTEKKSRKSSRT